ncbi:MAG: pyridoxal phosphate-dependent aminotransferase [Candidatus Diapherotrites archaeon]|nr:pyridoxal phosphate-dependent aminotransferase [Candidatus Diapherotrites archaeon]
MNQAIKRMSRSPMMDFFGKVPKNCINLSVGEPLFDTPKRITDFEIDSLIQGANRYTPVKGFLELREKLASKLAKDNHIITQPKDIVVTCGSSEAIGLTIQSTLNLGDNAIIIDPHFPIVAPQIEFTGGIVKRLSLMEKDHFQPDIDLLNKMIDKKTKLIYMNTPHNPTGSVFSKNSILEIIDIAIKNDIYLISDEVYEKIIYSDKHHSPASLSNYPKIITVNSFSKSYSMCGHRVGYVVTNSDLIDNIEKLKFSLSVSTPNSSQKAAICALDSDKESNEMAKLYKKRRDIIANTIGKLGLDFVLPKGAFYFFINVKRFGGGQKVYEMLLKNNIVVLPGIIFGKAYSDYIRISYVLNEAGLEKAMQKFTEIISQYNSHSELFR